MRFRLTPRSMALDDLELLIFRRISWDIADFGGNNSAKRKTRIVSDNVETH